MYDDDNTTIRRFARTNFIIRTVCKVILKFSFGNRIKLSFTEKHCICTYFIDEDVKFICFGSDSFAIPIYDVEKVIGRVIHYVIGLL